MQFVSIYWKFHEMRSSAVTFSISELCTTMFLFFYLVFSICFANRFVCTITDSVLNENSIIENSCIRFVCVAGGTGRKHGFLRFSHVMRYDGRHDFRPNRTQVRLGTGVRTFTGVTGETSRTVFIFSVRICTLAYA